MAEPRQLNITPEEIESGKAMAFVAYIIFFIPLLIEEQRKNKFVMYHTEQALVLVILWVIIWIAQAILSAIIFAISFHLYFLVVIINLLWIIPLVLWILGVVNALTGKVKEVPIVGQFGKIFNFVK
ncbi:MAG TPA: hypothetical protein PK447_05465 [Ignavibacteria bacterium]|nr:hypothetical protein [Ignavibacteria bacterium]